MTDKEALNPAAKQQPLSGPYATARRWPRYRVDVRAKVLLPGRDPLYGQSTDLSQGGMALFVPTELRVGQTIQAELMLPYCTETVSVSGVVRNRAGFRYGIEYLQVGERDRTLIERVCRALSIVQ